MKTSKDDTNDVTNDVMVRKMRTYMEADRRKTVQGRLVLVLILVVVFAVGRMLRGL